MKKFLIALLAVFLLAACSTKKEEPVVTPGEDIVEDTPTEEQNVGGWQINESLPEMNDAYFDNARKKLVGVNYSPLFVLGTQPVAGENIQYLCYATTVAPDEKPTFKIVTLFKNLENDDECEILNVSDFNVMNYLEGEGATTPEGMMGGWQDNGELPNMLSDDENEIFTKALEGLTGVGYQPVATLATQVVAGTNYAFLAVGTTVTANPVNHLYVVKVYADLQGNAEVQNICGIDLSEAIAK